MARNRINPKRIKTKFSKMNYVAIKYGQSNIADMVDDYKLLRRTAKNRLYKINEYAKDSQSGLAKQIFNNWKDNFPSLREIGDLDQVKAHL